MLARHRRSIPAPMFRAWDVQNDARCPDFGQPRCTDAACPRHQPVWYSEGMARHANDSL